MHEVPTYIIIIHFFCFTIHLKYFIENINFTIYNSNFVNVNVIFNLKLTQHFS
jgi:hypothetical protein